MIEESNSPDSGYGGENKVLSNQDNSQYGDDDEESIVYESEIE